MIFPKGKTFLYKKYFQKNPFLELFVTQNVDGNILLGIECPNTEHKYHQKSVTIDYHIKSDLEDNLPSDCHPYFGDDCEE